MTNYAILLVHLLEANLGIETIYSIYSLRKRLLAFLFAVAFIFCLFVGRLVYLQVFSREKLQGYALDQWTRDLPVKAIRGKIYDRNGVVLADIKTSYNLYIRPRMVKNQEETAKIISDVLNISYEKVLSKIKKKGTSEFTIAQNVEEAEMKTLIEKNLCGLYYTISNKRVYPHDESLAQVLGYTSIDGRGLSGLELYYNDILSGIDGKMLTETDLLGIEVEDGVTYFQKGVDGLNITTTIDLEIQLIAENALKRAYLSYSPKTAACIVMDPKSGEILAMSSIPSVDLNNLPRDDIQSLNALTRNTLLVDIYEPGSTFKVLTAAANVEEYLKGNKKAFSTSYIYSSSPIRVIDGQTIKCWDKHLNGRHSNQTLQEALQNSCNPCFVDIAVSLGIDKFYEYLNAFGYGKQSGVDFIGESSGILIPKTNVKNCDLARIGFGQTIAVSAMQLINATSAAVNGGYLYKPTFIKSITNSNGFIKYQSSKVVVSKPISEKTSGIMREYLKNVVEKGSGVHAKVDGVSVGGKTGTAQKYYNGSIVQGRYISSFVGFMPADNPQYICLVLVDEPQGGYYGSAVAAPVAQEIFSGIINLY